jgi:hypothetical protein
MFVIYSQDLLTHHVEIHDIHKNLTDAKKHIELCIKEYISSRTESGYKFTFLENDEELSATTPCIAIITQDIIVPVKGYFWNSFTTKKIEVLRFCIGKQIKSSKIVENDLNTPSPLSTSKQPIKTKSPWEIEQLELKLKLDKELKQALNLRRQKMNDLE